MECDERKKGWNPPRFPRGEGSAATARRARETTTLVYPSKGHTKAKRRKTLGFGQPGEPARGGGGDGWLQEVIRREPNKGGEVLCSAGLVGKRPLKESAVKKDCPP